MYHYFIEDRKLRLPPDLALWLTLSDSIYARLQQNNMISNMFEPSDFDCIMRQ